MSGVRPDLPSFAPLVAAGLPIGRVRIVRMPASLTKLLGSGVHAMTIGKTVFVHADHFDAVVSGGEPELLAHELVHVRQWADRGAVRFLHAYVTDYLRLRMYGLDHRQAYRGIGIEDEAFTEARRIVAAT